MESLSLEEYTSTKEDKGTLMQRPRFDSIRWIRCLLIHQHTRKLMLDRFVVRVNKWFCSFIWRSPHVDLLF